MIQKLEQRVIGTDYGCSGASFSEVIDKVNEVIDYINSRPEGIPPCQTGFKGHSDPVGRRGRQGMVPRWISEKAEEYQKQMDPPYDSDDIISAYESGAMENDKRFVYGPTGDPDPAGTSDLEEAAKEKAMSTRMGKIYPDLDGLKFDTRRRFAFLSKQAGKGFLLEPYIESMRLQIERKIADMPPAPEGYRYSWELEDFSKEGDSFSITSNIVLRHIDPEKK